MEFYFKAWFICLFAAIHTLLLWIDMGAIEAVSAYAYVHILLHCCLLPSFCVYAWDRSVLGPPCPSSSFLLIMPFFLNVCLLCSSCDTMCQTKTNGHFAFTTFSLVKQSVDTFLSHGCSSLVHSGLPHLCAGFMPLRANPRWEKGTLQLSLSVCVCGLLVSLQQEGSVSLRKGWLNAYSCANDLTMCVNAGLLTLWMRIRRSWLCPHLLWLILMMRNEVVLLMQQVFMFWVEHCEVPDKNS